MIQRRPTTIKKWAAKAEARGVDWNTANTEATFETVDETFCDIEIATVQALIEGGAPSDVRVRAEVTPKIMKLSARQSL